jgi:hypothetical protein
MGLPKNGKPHAKTPASPERLAMAGMGRHGVKQFINIFSLRALRLCVSYLFFQKETLL